MNDTSVGLGSTELRWAMTGAKPEPATPEMLEKLAAEMEEAAIENEVGFSHPDWPVIDGLRLLASRLREYPRVADREFKHWYAQPCERCGGPRNYRVQGHFQTVCFECASPAVIPLRGESER